MYVINQRKYQNIIPTKGGFKIYVKIVRTVKENKMRKKNPERDREMKLKRANKRKKTEKHNYLDGFDPRRRRKQ